jgi:F420-non-reducing hydrogenase iron-sulfur subunit
MASLRPQANTGEAVAPVIVAFVCANCARAGQTPTSGKRYRPRAPSFVWPTTVHAHEVVVPCAGRLQPEHVLKVFESGADAVCIVACEEDNCHHLAGSKRCAKRAAYVDDLLTQVGLGKNRVMLFHLPGSARQDMALGLGQSIKEDPRMDEKIGSVRDEVVVRLRALRINPLHRPTLPEDMLYEVDDHDESNE